MSPTLAICILWRAFDSRLTSSLSVPFWCEPHGRLSTHSAPHNNGFYFRWTTTTLLIAEHVCRRLDHNAGDTVLSEWEWRAYVVGRSNLRYVTQIKFFIFRFILQTHLFGGYLNLFQFVFFFCFALRVKYWIMVLRSHFERMQSKWAGTGSSLLLSRSS